MFFLYLICAAVLLGWMLISFYNNKNIIDQLSQNAKLLGVEIDDYERKQAAMPSKSLALILPELVTLEQLPTGWNEINEKPAYSEKAGLSQRKVLSPHTIDTYKATLQGVFLSLLINDLEYSFNSNLNAFNIKLCNFNSKPECICDQTSVNKIVKPIWVFFIDKYKYVYYYRYNIQKKTTTKLEKKKTQTN